MEKPMVAELLIAPESPRLAPPQFIARAALRHMAAKARPHMKGSIIVEIDGAKPERILDTSSNQPLNGDKPGHMVIHNPSAMLTSAMWSGSVGLGESYMRGEWSAPGGPDALIITLTEALNDYNRFRLINNGSIFYRSILDRITRAKFSFNAASDADAISFHYDEDHIGSWLDDGARMYSSALFLKHCPPGQDFGVPADPIKGDTIELAQDRKNARICNILDIQPGHAVLEIGSGYGGFAMAAARRGAKVKTTTLSREQQRIAQERAKEAGFDHLIDVVYEDYRDTVKLSDRFDRVVSIGMIEHVEDLAGYAAGVRDVLKEGGQALLHYITHPEREYEQHIRATNFLREYIFPNCILTTPGRSIDTLREAGLTFHQYFSFGPSYGDTLLEWNRRFQAANIHDSSAERKRMQEFYFASVAAGFYLGYLDVGHFHVSKGPKALKLAR